MLADDRVAFAGIENQPVIVVAVHFGDETHGFELLSENVPKGRVDSFKIP